MELGEFGAPRSSELRRTRRASMVSLMRLPPKELRALGRLNCVDVSMNITGHMYVEVKA